MNVSTSPTERRHAVSGAPSSRTGVAQVSARTTLSKHPCSLRNTLSCRMQWVGQRDALVGWAASLDREWSLFLTLTFRPEKRVPQHHAITAGQRFVRWCSAWRDPILGVPLFRCSLWSAESHLTGDVHIHAISACTPLTSVAHMRTSRETVASSGPRSCRVCDRGALDDPLWLRLKESWFAHYGIARIYPYDAKYRFGAEGYVVKYVLDEKCLDWGVVTA